MFYLNVSSEVRAGDSLVTAALGVPYEEARRRLEARTGFARASHSGCAPGRITC